MKSVLFICTGNFYRSRFAAAYLRALRPDLNVSSVGLEVFAKRNRGRISDHVNDFAELRDLKLNFTPREKPVQAKAGHFIAFDYCVAMDREEHYPMMGRYFPLWQESLDYWEVADVDRRDWISALDEVKSRVETLANSI